MQIVEDEQQHIVYNRHLLDLARQVRRRVLADLEFPFEVLLHVAHPLGEDRPLAQGEITKIYYLEGKIALPKLVSVAYASKAPKIDGKMAEAPWYLSGPYAITVGEPMYFEGDVEDREHVRTVSESIMRQIRLLTAESKGRILPGKRVLTPGL